MTGRRGQRQAILAAILLPLLVAAGCRNYLVRASVVNDTGGVVNLLEVDYPSASFGVDSMAPGAVYRQRLQLRDEGPVKVEYTDPNRHQHQATGPTLAEKQAGTLEIVLLPGGKVEFNAHLTPAR